MKPKAVIFDMDGVITDSPAVWFDVFARHFNPYRKLKKEHWGALSGKNIAAITDIFLAESNLTSEEKQSIVKSIQVDAEIEVVEKANLKPGLVELLGRLEGQKLPAVVASSAPMEVIKATVVKHQIEGYFKGFFSGEEVAHSKPHPELFMNAADSLEVGYKDCIVIEDSYQGIIAALAGNLRAVYLIDKYSYEPKGSVIAELTIDHFSELSDILNL